MAGQGVGIADGAARDPETQPGRERQPVDHALEGAVEFLDVQLIGHEICKLGNLPAVVVPLKGRNGCRRVKGRQLADLVRRPCEWVSGPERQKTVIAARLTEGPSTPSDTPLSPRASKLPNGGTGSADGCRREVVPGA